MSNSNSNCLCNQTCDQDESIICVCRCNFCEEVRGYYCEKCGGVVKSQDWDFEFKLCRYCSETIYNSRKDYS